VELTILLQQMQSGDSLAREKLMDLIYDELHRIAQYHLRSERPAHTLQPTALVHEAYLRLFGSSQPKYADRAHFLRMTSVVMRRILIDYARSRKARGAGHESLTINPNRKAQENAIDTVELLGLDSALDALAQEKKASAEYVEMQYFGGMTAEEIAAATGKSVHIVRQGLRFAQAWLRRHMQ
jgi:RNA polymerase sigma factor (TIGR02999 family)